MWEKVVGHGTAFFVGLFIGFFFVLAPLFAHGSWNEYILPIFLVMVFFLIAGLSFGATVPGSMTFLTLSIPTMVMVIIYGIIDKPDEGYYYVLFTLFPIIVILSSFGGERVGYWLRHRKGKS
jgi:hypothetical protein